MLSLGIRYMLLAGLAFAVMQVCVKYLVRIPAHEIILFRSVITLVLSLSWLVYHRVPIWGNNRKLLWLRGIFGIIALTSFVITLKHIPLASAVTLQNLSPIFTIFLAQFILGEKVRKWQWLFFGISFVGIAFIKGFDPRISGFYLGIGLLSAVFAGLAYNCVRKLKDTDHPVVVVLYFPLIATPVMGGYSLFHWVTPLGYDWFWLILMGICTQLGQVFMTLSLRAEEANKVSGLKHMGAIYGLILGYFLFDETYALLSLLGIALVLAGVVLNTYYVNLWSKKTSD